MARTASPHLKRVNLYVDSQVYEAMRWLADNSGTTASELLRQAARQYAVEKLRENREINTLIGTAASLQAEKHTPDTEQDLSDESTRVTA